MRTLAKSIILLLALTTTAFGQQRGGRGAGSVSGTAISKPSPLIIVDGVIVSDVCPGLGGDARDAAVRVNGQRLGNIAGLNADEIESVEVVKGAAAAAYGPKAADGVISITTKTGQHFCVDQSPASLQDPFGRFLFPPDLVMAQQREIGLSDDQRATIVNDLQKSQASFVDLQWKMSTETEQLERLLEGANVNESAVLAQLDRVLAMEREIKRAQVSLLIRVRNTLTPQQQARLTELRKGR